MVIFEVLLNWWAFLGHNPDVTFVLLLLGGMFVGCTEIVEGK
jgi:hypothetical protein